jgi:hypothetical protein
MAWVLPPAKTKSGAHLYRQDRPLVKTTDSRVYTVRLLAQCHQIDSIGWHRALQQIDDLSAERQSS